MRLLRSIGVRKSLGLVALLLVVGAALALAVSTVEAKPKGPKPSATFDVDFSGDVEGSVELIMKFQRQGTHFRREQPER